MPSELNKSPTGNSAVKKKRPSLRKLFRLHDEPVSLLGEILDWMLVPLVVLWPISIAITHHIAYDIAQTPYDADLSKNLSLLVAAVEADGSVEAANDLTGRWRNISRRLPVTDDQDALYFQVRNVVSFVPTGTTETSDSTSLPHEIMLGDQELPPLKSTFSPPQASSQVFFRDVVSRGQRLRLAYRYLNNPQSGGSLLLLQVGETRHKRDSLASRIILGVLLPQFAILPLATLLAYLGLSQGLRPLSRLQRRLSQRQPEDLSPIDTRRVADELQPLILALNSLMARLEVNLAVQRRFVADAAHQMRTPLTGLKTQTELALSVDDPIQMRRSLAKIAFSAERTSHLISQLLSLARAEAIDSQVYQREVLDLSALALRVVSDWVPRAMEKRIDLGFEGSAWHLPINGMALLLDELLANLIDNALKYTPSGGQVTVRVWGEPDWAYLEVEDNGVGIAPEDQPRVFERFYRVLGNESLGSGLGLPICREITDFHHATLTLISQPTLKGTCLRVVFPRVGGMGEEGDVDGDEEGDEVSDDDR
jgi:two-component system sensor histidine kinase TctE